jgi:redox-sensitive bicupin YhaK (pirin superfamily)
MFRRVIGNRDAPGYDPFLLLDDFRSSSPEFFEAGFPWHPHRGIETITYMLEGTVEHKDSLGNHGVIEPGDVQWMTAGSGIIHQEMPKGDPAGRMGGFQLWANLPARQKMMDPRYREVLSSQIPSLTDETGSTVRIISGEVDGIKGPVQDIVTDPEYLDITVPANSRYMRSTKPGHIVLAYVIGGSGAFDSNQTRVADGQLAVYGDGDDIEVNTGESSVRFLYLSGQPIGEPVAWYGPIVMNTEEEIRTAIREYQTGKFIKYKG